jgi:YfiH family protein
VRSGNGETDDVSELGGDVAPPAARWRVPEWDAIPQLVHGFLGRAHGLGPGTFDLDLIRARLIDAGETPRLVLAVRQIHGAEVRSPEDPAWAGLDWHDPAERLPTGDALVTASADVIVTIRTADCVPILLVAPGARAVAAVHAGWRGLLTGVVEQSVAALGERYGARPATIEAAIGPAIGGCCYEFGAEHQQGFVARYGAAAATAWRPGPSGRGHLDVRRLVALALTAAGLPPTAIRTLGPCTAEHPETLHSYRRDGARAGRQLSYIGWRAD